MQLKFIPSCKSVFVFIIIIIIIIIIIEKSLFNTHKKDLCTVLHLKRIKFVP